MLIPGPETYGADGSDSSPSGLTAETAYIYLDVSGSVAPVGSAVIVIPIILGGAMAGAVLMSVMVQLVSANRCSFFREYPRQVIHITSAICKKCNPCKSFSAYGVVISYGVPPLIINPALLPFGYAAV